MVTEETRAGTRRKISRGHTALKWLGGCRKRRKDISVYIYIYIFLYLGSSVLPFLQRCKSGGAGPHCFAKGRGATILSNVTAGT